jgi:hypothetical protein
MTDAPNLTDQVINAFGSVTALAKALGHKNVTTVHSWKQTGRSPHWRRDKIIAAAAREKVDLPEAFLAEDADA